MSRLRLLLGLLFVCAASPSATAQPAGRGAWMKQARWGVMTHYLGDWIARRENFNGGRMTVERWNELVDHFDVEALAKQLESVGAGYYLITIGQNSGFYLSPNATYDRFAGVTPSHCSRRDLVADLYEPLNRRGIKLVVYLPSGAPAGDRVAREALQWQNGPHRNREFQEKWEAIIREWSQRWGTKVVGWWFDGCYWPNTMYRADDGGPGFASLAAAARAGNPAGVVAFNPGVVYRTMSITPHEDYLAGEVDQPDRWSLKRNVDGKVDGAQIQMLSYLGQSWGRGDPRFTTEQVIGFTRAVRDGGAVITWDVPIQSGGTIAQPFVDQLTVVGKVVREPASTKPTPATAPTD